VSRSLKAHLLLILATFFWGVTFVQIKDALQQATPFTFNAVRMIVGAVALILVYRSHLTKVPAATLKVSVLLGALLWAGYSFQTKGLVYTTPSKSAFITGVSIVLVPIFLALFWRGHVNRRTVFGIALAMVGLYLLTVPASGGGFGLGSINRGDLLTLGCAIVFGFQIIVVGKVMMHHRFEHVGPLQIVAAATFMVFSAPLMERPAIIWSPRVIAAVLVTGLLCTAAAFTIQAWAQQFLPPTHTALIFLMEQVFAWLASYVVLHERLGLRATLGALLILGGILFAELKGTEEELKAELGSDVSPEAGNVRSR
jgi:drug/metabolite transporter (DMT)-like permease